MPAPFDQATTLLTTGANAVRTFYHEDFNDQFGRFGKAENRIMKISKRRIDGNGIQVQVKSAGMYGARTSTNLNAEFPAPKAFLSDSYTATLDEGGTASNHYRRLALSLSATHLDIKRKMNDRAAAVNWIKELQTESMSNIRESMALHLHLDSTARLGLVNGTPTQNDNRLHASASATPAASTGIRFPVDNGSIAAFPKNLDVDVYVGATGALRMANGANVSDYNARDSSVGLYALNASGVVDTSLTLAAIADNDSIYVKGEKDQNILGWGHWFSSPSSGDSFFGRDRTNPLYRWLRPYQDGPTSATAFDMSHLDNLSINMGYVLEEDDDGAYVVLTTPELDQRFRNIVGADAIIQWPTTEQKGEVVAQYGFTGSIFRHPRLGRIMLKTSPLAPKGIMRGFKLGDWEMSTPFSNGGESGGFEWLPGQIGDNWYRVGSTTPGNGDTTTYRMDGMLAMCTLCTFPGRQWEIANLLP